MNDEKLIALTITSLFVKVPSSDHADKGGQTSYSRYHQMSITRRIQSEVSYYTLADLNCGPWFKLPKLWCKKSTWNQLDEELHKSLVRGRYD